MTRRASLLLTGLALLFPACASAQDEPIADWTGAPETIPYVVLEAHAFDGAILVSDGRSGGISSPQVDYETGQAWPWASVTKQVIAVLVMQEVEAGRLVLDAPASAYLGQLGEGAPSPTVRQLLQHRSGLPDPDTTEAGADGVPSFYGKGPTGLNWCLADRTAPSDEWTYNNCDYIVLGALLEQVTDQPIADLVARRIGEPSGWTGTRLAESDASLGYVGGSADYTSRIARYGTSAALVGPLEDMLAFDRALLGGDLLGEVALATLWEGDPSLGYMALGQWVFEAPLRHCDAPVRIVERRGGIGKYQVRNIILPDLAIAVAMATDQDDFEFGEIWMGNGAMHDVLSAIACG